GTAGKLSSDGLDGIASLTVDTEPGANSRATVLATATARIATGPPSAHEAKMPSPSAAPGRTLRHEAHPGMTKTSGADMRQKHSNPDTAAMTRVLFTVCLSRATVMPTANTATP